MSLPVRVFVLARMPTAGPGEDPMRLYTVAGPDNPAVTPVFSSIVNAARFLEGAQAVGVTIPFDYVFPATESQFAAEFAGYTPILDPAAADFFQVATPKPAD